MKHISLTEEYLIPIEGNVFKVVSGKDIVDSFVKKRKNKKTIYSAINRHISMTCSALKKGKWSTGSSFNAEQVLNKLYDNLIKVDSNNEIFLNIISSKFKEFIINDYTIYRIAIVNKDKIKISRVGSIHTKKTKSKKQKLFDDFSSLGEHTWRNVNGIWIKDKEPEFNSKLWGYD